MWIYTIAALASIFASRVAADDVYVRVNQLGYRPGDVKVAVAMARAHMPAKFQVVDAASRRRYSKARCERLKRNGGSSITTLDWIFPSSIRRASISCVLGTRSRQRFESRLRHTPSCPINYWSSCGSSGVGTTPGSMPCAIRSMAGRSMGRCRPAAMWMPAAVGMMRAIS